MMYSFLSGLVFPSIFFRLPPLLMSGAGEAGIAEKRTKMK